LSAAIFTGAAIFAGTAIAFFTVSAFLGTICTNGTVLSLSILTPEKISSLCLICAYIVVFIFGASITAFTGAETGLTGTVCLTSTFLIGD